MQAVVFVRGHIVSICGQLFLNVGGHGHLGAMSSSCDGGCGWHCRVVWSWCSGSVVVVLGHCRLWCWALVGVSGWWHWGLVAVHQWWNWVLVTICW